MHNGAVDHCMERKVKRRTWQIGLLLLPLVALGLHLFPFTQPPRITNPVRWLIGLEATRPQRTDHGADLFHGVAYTRQLRSRPRPLVVHTVTVDLTAPDIGFLVTPHAPGTKVGAQPTTAFLRQHGVQIAINGSYFGPFWVRSPWNFYPRQGDPVELRGLAMANGLVYSEPEEGWPVLCVAGDRVSIDRAACPPETTQALAGNRMLVEDGRAVHYANLSIHPRTAVATTADGDTLWLVVVDGRQRRYSEGVTLAELAEIMLELGADAALNLDGGGSSTLVASTAGGPELLNAPIHTDIPMRQRPVANHLGIFARPLDVIDLLD